LSGMALAVILIVVVVLGLGGRTLSLARQVQDLRAEVAALAQHDEPAELERPGEVPQPIDKPAEEVVLRPTPLGPGDAEPDLSVTSLAVVTLSGPLIKAAALSHGVRRALTEETRMRAAHAFRKELRRQHRMRRRNNGAVAGPPRQAGWRS
jgi:hypothetical protein